MKDAPAPESEAFIDLYHRRDRYARMLGIEVVHAVPGRATTRLTVDDNHMNFFDVGHGGMIFSLADTAFGVAANAGGRISAMVDAHITLTHAVGKGDVLTATAEETTRSRRLAVYRCLVTRARGGEDTTIATFTGTVYLTEKRLEA